MVGQRSYELPAPDHLLYQAMAKAYKPLPHASELWELFDYKPLTGELVRRSSAGGQLGGEVVGCRVRTGYIRARVHRANYVVHRLVWGWVTGSDPGALEVDHRDRVRHNNRFWNLRLSTQPQNRQNAATRAHSQSKTKGAQRLPSGKYRARITCSGEVYRLGTYLTAEEAGAAYAEAAKRLHGEFACVD